MPRKIYTIERFSADINQDSRMFNLPKILRGRLDRRGGVTHDYTYQVDATPFRLLGYDWLGHSVWYNENNDDPLNVSPGDTVVMRGDYLQSDDFGSHIADTLVFPSSINVGIRPNGFIPGAGFLWLPTHPLRMDPDDVTMPGYFYHSCSPWCHWFGDTDSRVIDSWGWGSTGGHIPAGTKVLVLAIGFKRATNGLFPVAMSAVEDEAPYDNAYFGIVWYTNFDAVKVYATAYPLTGYDFRYWYPVPVDLENRNAFFKGETPAPSPSNPWFYFGASDQLASGHSYYPGSTGVTYALSRTWHIQWYKTASSSLTPATYLPQWIFSPEVRSYVSIAYAYDFVKFARDIVFFSDPGYLGFSDTYNPNFIMVDDVVYGLTPSPRGIYVFGEMGVYEAYGDFTTAGGTRVSMVPIISGVDFYDDDVYNRWPIAFSGDVAYAVKENTVYQLGSGGVRHIGLPMNEVDGSRIKRIYYDRQSRELFVILEDSRVYSFDPVLGQWRRREEDFESLVGAGEMVLVKTNDNEYRGDLRVLDMTAPLSNGAEIVWESLDFSTPLIRKRISRILIPDYERSGDVYVDIKRSGTGTWSPCAVIYTDDGIEARCPSVVARKFDVRIVLDGEGTINPPVIVIYEARERSYEQD